VTAVATAPLPVGGAIAGAPRTRGPWVVLVAALVVGLPLLVALLALHSPRWYPLGDLAQTEMRVRAVWSAHPPLIGLPGRIGSYPDQGSHPGPLSFYALWPVYAALGSTAFALQAASVLLHGVAMALTLWLAWRRGGWRMLFAIGAVLAVVLHTLGFDVFLEPWNPYLPLMVWVLFVVAVWSVCCEDWPALVVVTVAGSFCVQTHVSYVAPVGALGVLAIVAVVRAWKSERTKRWTAIAAGAGLLLWAPPVVEQLTSSHGNLSELWDYFRHPPESAIGFRKGGELLLAHLDPWNLLAGQHGPGGTLLPGFGLLVVWAVSVAVAWRPGPSSLRALHVVLAVALLGELVALSRIFGDIFFYLMLWTFAIGALMLVAIGWSTAAAIGDRRVLDGLAVGALAVALVFTGWFAVDNRDVHMPLERLGGGLAGVLPRTERSLRAIERAHEADGASKPFLVTWTDPIALGGRGVAFMNELERDGFTVKTTAASRAAVRPEHVVDPKQALEQVHLSIGSDIARWRAKPGVQEIASFDSRTPAERAESARLRVEVRRLLRARGLDRLLSVVDDSIYAAVVDPRMPAAALPKLRRIGDLDLPAAVFLAPTDVT
jgi:hypothetical protein